MSEKEIQGIVAHIFEEQGLASFARNADNGAEIAMPMQNSMVQTGRVLSSDRLTMVEYHNMALETAIYPEELKVIYPALGLTGEAGEVSDKVKKLIRDKGFKGGEVENAKDREDIAYELGDVLWYIVTLANDLDYTLEQIAMMNYLKLHKRKEMGKLSGSGDHREESEEPLVEGKRMGVTLTPGVFLLILSLGILIGFISQWI